MANQLDEKTKSNKGTPEVPEEVFLREYQLNAIESWKKNNCTGIFDMATGTDKIYTALAGVVELYKTNNETLGFIIVCPYQHTVEQWRNDVKSFGMNPIICYSSSDQRNWKKRLQDVVISFKLGIKRHF